LYESSCTAVNALFPYRRIAYYTHGCIALDEGTDESARRAVVHFENCVKVGKAIGFARGFANAKSNILID
jgi:hypothetical protein